MKKGELTLEHGALSGSRGERGQLPQRAQQQVLDRHQDPHSPGPGPAEARPSGRAPPSGAARQSSTPISILTQAVAARRPRRRSPRAGSTRGKPRPGPGGERWGAGRSGNGGGGAGALGAELGKETAPRSSAGPSPLLRPGTPGCPP